MDFATKLYLRSETYIAYKFYAGYHQKGDFLCVENIMRMLDPFFI